jgi:formylglycine-generating enzyme required for sulfatase activity/O-acetyl-ADP-ribose deacetylase (regulator of RNase III)
MSTVIASGLVVEPILQYPRLAAVNHAFLLTVDLRSQQFGDTWAYPDLEEIPIRCIINPGTLFRVEFLGEPVVIVHRYGGTYSPARFLLTPEANRIGESGKIRITLANRFGVPITAIETEEIEVRNEVSAESLIAIAKKPLEEVWDELANPESQSDERHLLCQQGNIRIYSQCTAEPWKLSFDAFVISVGVAVDLTGSLASALKKHIGEANSLQLEAEIQRILEQKHQTTIAPEDPLIVPLSAEINSFLNPAESDREHFLICATVESPRPTIENAAKAIEAAITLSLERKLKRIVISLLGTGVNRLPVDEVAKAMLSKLHQVLSESSSNSIEEIIFVDQKGNFIEIVNQVAQSLQNHKLLSFEFDIAEIVFEEESRIPLETFPFRQVNIEVLLFRSENFTSQDTPEGIHPNIERINAEFIRSNCIRGLESLQTEQEKVQFAKAMWMSTDFGEDGINPVNTCSLQQIVKETELAMDILQTMGIALDRQNALRYLQELNNGLSNLHLGNITDRSLSDNYQRLFNRQPGTSGERLLCTYVEWFHLCDNLVTVVGKKEQPKAIILPDELTKLIPHNWEPECCPKPERIVTFQYTTHQSQQYTEVLAGNVSLQMVCIPQGGFMMGAPEDEEDSMDRERPQHQVSVEAFFLGKYSITQAQYEAVMGENPSSFKDEPDSPNHPVENVSWDDAIEFCRRLSEQTSKEYRLPSEAEWEYACRAGTNTPFHFGETIDAEIANYNASVTYGRGKEGEYRSKTTPVGYFKVANAFGLFDMHGNVWEWCADNWHDDYEGALKDGTTWIEGGRAYRHPLRGGSCYYFPQNCRSAFRFINAAVNRFNYIGFRVACSV